jgi:hypothetical protein
MSDLHPLVHPEQVCQMALTRACDSNAERQSGLLRQASRRQKVTTGFQKAARL